MMADTVIRVENLSKKYVIDHQSPGGYSTLRDKITGGAKSLSRLLTPGKKSDRPTREEFWALKDVSFEVKQGDRLGIIGRNGAGKSTLLKILSRITEPTAGEISITGRVASLLEVGTGFHPELTGRENIFLNGAILGMSKAEIRRKFDEIVAFAEVEKFLDTPVKRYSSGMYVRLAFAVAAHLESEILIVDEVLAVGDIKFRQKCLGKIQDVSANGRTIIFVSHHMPSVSHLCTACLLLENGVSVFDGKTNHAIRIYLDSLENKKNDRNDLQLCRPSWAKSLITSARILNSEYQEQNHFPLGSDIVFEMTFTTQDEFPIKFPTMGVVINHATFGVVGGINNRMTGFRVRESSYTSVTMRCILKQIPVLQGKYTVDLWLSDHATDLDTLTGYLKFDVEETDVYKSGYTPFSGLGMIFLDAKWEIFEN
jgi:lipopolysaccharide transport system ATP-binding protein